jgi:hypothetical protein
VSAALYALTECQCVRGERPSESEGRTARACNMLNRRRASDSPSPGECRVSRTPTNARTWMSGPARSVAGIAERQRHERPGQSENSAGAEVVTTAKSAHQAIVAAEEAVSNKTGKLGPAMRYAAAATAPMRWAQRKPTKRGGTDVGEPSCWMRTRDSSLNSGRFERRGAWKVLIEKIWYRTAKA